MVVSLWGRDKLAVDSGVTDGGGWGGVRSPTMSASPDEVDAVIEDARARRSARLREVPDALGWLQRCSSTQTAIPGRWRTTRTGPSTTTAA